VSLSGYRKGNQARRPELNQMHGKTFKAQAFAKLAAKNPGLKLEWTFYKASKYRRGHQWAGQKTIHARAVATAPGVRTQIVSVNWSEPQGMWVK
jgi:hypothetical protein